MSEEEHNQPQNLPSDLLNVGELISLAEAARLTGLSQTYLRTIAENNRLSARKIGRNWVTTKAAVDDYLKTRKFIYPKDKTS